jgi:hypothetical protein
MRIPYHSNRLLPLVVADSASSFYDTKINLAEFYNQRYFLLFAILVMLIIWLVHGRPFIHADSAPSSSSLNINSSYPADTEWWSSAYLINAIYDLPRLEKSADFSTIPNAIVAAAGTRTRLPRRIQ